jgi:hypothetical protein
MKPVFAGLAAALMLSGCATNARLHDADRLALYQQHAGEPVPSFRYFTSISGWTPLGDSALAVWARPNEAYLLTLNGSCTDLQFAMGISLTHQFRTVYARFDRVVPHGSTSTTMIPCPIREIRPLDIAAIKEAQREMREDVREASRE